VVDPPLKKLRAKRIRTHRQLDKLEPLIAGYRAKLAEVEAAIQALAPELPLPTRHRTYQPNPYFARGELPRVALAVLREAVGAATDPHHRGAVSGTEELPDTKLGACLR
jgi:hypothetical protein